MKICVKLTEKTAAIEQVFRRDVMKQGLPRVTRFASGAIRVDPGDVTVVTSELYERTGVDLGRLG